MNEYQEKRKGMGLTRRKLAILLGVTEMTIYNRETGKYEVKPEHMLALEALQQTLKA